MHRGVTRQAFEPSRHVQELRSIILFVHLAERRHGLDRLVDRHVRLGRYQFRDPVAVAERDVEPRPASRITAWRPWSRT